jgi:acetaldehyde dehydrogenase/alcohol dehydrogenase
MQYSQLINAGRIVVNTPTTQGAVGGILNNLDPSLTLGCGTGGKNITTENITARHLINVQRVCRRRLNHKFLDADQKIYFNEKMTETELFIEYHKNH